MSPVFYDSIYSSSEARGAESRSFLRMKPFSGQSADRGFSIIEAIIGVAVFSMLASGAIIAVLGPLIISADAWQRSRAAFLAEEGIEAARAIRSDGWVNLTDGAHGLTKVSGAGCVADECWSFSGVYDETTDNKVVFRRVVTVEPVERDDVTHDIVESGGTVDAHTKKVTAVITWTSPFGISRKLTSRTYLTDWNAYQWKQTTDSDFLGGDLTNQTDVEGTGDDASVALAADISALKSWTPSEGNLTVHTSADAWNAGTFTDTQVQGIGQNAVVTGIKSNMQWIEIYAGKSFYLTTDSHFNNLGNPVTGSFSNTVTVDTGDLGAVALNTRLSWAALSSGVTDHLNDVDCVSSSFCVAVGAGGRIISWNGSSWSTVNSPTTNALNDVDMISASLGFIGGAGTNPGTGTVLKWDGANWTAMATPTDNINQIYMLSSSDGFMVGRSGKFWRYIGSIWNEILDTGNENWQSVHMLSSSDGWAVSSGSDVRRWNGSAWNTVSDPTNRFYYDVACASASFCFAVGSNGVIIKWNGSSWAQDPNSQTLTTNVLRDVNLLSSTDGWAVGDGGTILRWNGSAWSLATSPGTTHMLGVTQVSSTEAFAVGNSGTVWRYSYYYYTSGTYTSRVLDSGVPGGVTWGHVFWDEDIPDTGAVVTDLTITFRSGNTTNPNDGTWSGWLPTPQPLTDPFYSDITAPDSRYVQYRATFRSDGQLYTPRLNGIAIYYDEPNDNAFYDVKVTSATDGWAVGGGGTMSRFNGTDWARYTPSPTANSLLDVDFTDASHVWAVGDNGTIVFWDGSGWAAQTSNTTNTLFGVDTVSASFAVAVGAKGTIRHWGGSSWSTVLSPTNKKLNAVSCATASDCWAVGDNGTVIHWNGGSWSSVSTSAVHALNGVFTWDSDTAYAVGAGGLIMHWNGSAWAVKDSTTPNELRDVHCALENDCWAWGIEQTFLHWDGSAWSRYVFTNPSNPLVQGGYMISLSDGWAVGEGGAVYHYTSVYPSPAYWRSPVIDGGTSGIKWNTLSWDSTEPMGTGMSIVTRTCDGPDPATCTWSAWSTAMTDKGGTTITSPAGRYLQYEVVFTTTIGYNTATLSEVRIIDSAATGQTLYDIDGVAETDVWSVGRSGTIVHYDGTSWSTVISPTVKDLRGIDQLATDSAYAVGVSGTFLRWGGTAWSELTPSPTSQDMYAVSMLTDSLGYAVGTSGEMAKWNGGSWINDAVVTTQNLRGVYLYSSTLGFAVGDNGVILQWNGSSWSVIPSSPTSAQLNAVHIIAANQAVAVGNGGVIIKWNGTSWSLDTSSPVVANLNAVEFRSATEAWAGGDFGTILSWDNKNDWQSFTSPTTRTRYGITVLAPTDGWMCGQNGALVKDPPPYAAAGTFLSSVLDADSAAFWDTVFFNITVPANTTISIAVRSGGISVPDASWSDWSAEMTTGELAAIPVPSARYLQYRATLTTADPLVSPLLEDMTVTYHK